MLILSRLVGESIVIDGSIRVTVVGLQNGRVKLGIEAPDGVAVDRSEIHEIKLRQESIEQQAQAQDRFALQEQLELAS